MLMGRTLYILAALFVFSLPPTHAGMEDADPTGHGLVRTLSSPTSEDASSIDNQNTVTPHQTSFLDLPEEILGDIIRRVDTQDVPALVQVSSTLHRLGWAHSTHTITFKQNECHSLPDWAHTQTQSGTLPSFSSTLQSLESLQLNCQNSDSFWNYMGIPKLQHLTLNSPCPYPYNTLKEATPSLKSFALRMPHRLNAFLPQILPLLPGGLERLSVIGPMGATSYESLTTALQRFEGLRKLTLYSTGQTPARMQSLLSVLPTLSQLNQLNLSGNRMYAPDVLPELMKAIPKLTHLQTLKLASIAMDFKNTESLFQALSGLSDLRHLDLSHNDLFDCKTDPFTTCPTTSFTQLEVLNLGSTNLGPEGAEALARILPQMKNLEVLDLSCNYLGGAGVTALAAVLKQLRQLHTLDLRPHASSAAVLDPVLEQLQLEVDLSHDGF